MADGWECRLLTDISHEGGIIFDSDMGIWTGWGPESYSVTKINEGLLIFLSEAKYIAILRVVFAVICI